MKSIRSLMFFVLLALFITPSTYAQALLPDTQVYSKNATGVIDYYNENIKGQTELYNGPKYEIMPPANKGTYYFGDNVYCTPATVYFNGTWYKNLPVLYDVYHDQMISYTGDNFFVLDKTKNTDIKLLDHHFKYLDQPGLNPGYFDVLYNGKSQALAKRTKVVNEDIISQREVQTTVVDKTQLYLKKGNTFFPVTGKNSVLSIFSDRKKEIKQFLHDQKIDFNLDKEAAFIVIARYYDQLNK